MFFCKPQQPSHEIAFIIFIAKLWVNTLPLVAGIFITKITYSNGEAPRLMSYDRLGRLLTAANPSSTITRSYDAAGRLLSETQAHTAGPSGTFTYQYDIDGNLKKHIRPDGSFIDYTWNARNLLASVISDAPPPLATYTYNARNQIATTTVENGLFTVARSYDALGRRTKRVETIGGNTTTTYFFNNSWNVELEHNGSNYTTRLSWGLDVSDTLVGAGGVGGLIMVESLPVGGNAMPYFPTYDGNGNITAWVDSTGTVIARQRYDAFGNIIQKLGIAPINYGFNTKHYDNITGFLYYGMRHYDVETGRWLSKDPIHELGGINQFAMVSNNLLSYLDFLGLCKEDIDKLSDQQYSYIFSYSGNGQRRLQISGNLTITFDCECKPNVIIDPDSDSFKTVETKTFGFVKRDLSISGTLKALDAYGNGGSKEDTITDGCISRKCTSNIYARATLNLSFTQKNSLKWDVAGWLPPALAAGGTIFDFSAQHTITKTDTATAGPYPASATLCCGKEKKDGD